MKHKSIGDRLRRAKSADVKAEVARDWATNWQREHDDLVAQLERAVSSMDYDALCSITGQIKAVGIKRHGALPRVMAALQEQDR